MKRERKREYFTVLSPVTTVFGGICFYHNGEARERGEREMCRLGISRVLPMKLSSKRSGRVRRRGRGRGGGPGGRSGRLGSCLCSLKLLLLGLRWTEVWIFDHGGHVHPIVLSVGQTSPDEVLGLLTDCRTIGELDVRGFEDNIFFQDCGLRLVMTKGL